VAPMTARGARQARRYPGISPRAYEHPADRAATAALGRIPVLDRVLRLLAGIRFERALRQRLLGNAVRIGPDQLPQVWESHLEARRCLDIEAEVELYVGQHPFANVVTIGIDRPVVVLHSALLTTLGPEEVRGVLAHEAAHVLSGHLLYRTSLAVLLTTSLQRLPPLGDLPRRALVLALSEWFRASELSCDRAEVLATGDPSVVCSALMRLAAGSVPGLELGPFLRQAEEFRDWSSAWDRGLRTLDELDSRYPWSVRRALEVSDWVRSGEFDRIVRGDYIRRGSEPPVTAEMQGAVEHYRQRFADLIESTGLGITQLTSRLRDWLRRASAQAADS